MVLMWRKKLKHIIGTPDQNNWAQVHHFVPQKEEKFQTRGELILLISLKGLESTQEPAVLGKEVISRFHEEYYGQTSEKPMAALKAVMAKVGQEEAKFFPSPGQLSLVALVFWKEVVYLAVWDDGEIRLRRDMQTQTLIKGESKQSRVISGHAKENDLYLLANSDFVDQVPAEMLTASLSTEDLETIGEILTPVVHAQKDQAQLAAVFVKLFEKEEKKLKTIPDQPPEEKPPKESKVSTFKKKFRFNLNPAALKKIMFSKTAGLILALILFGVLSVSVYMGWQKRQQQKREKRISILSSQIEEKLDVARQIRGLDPENSLKAAQEAEPIIKELAELDKQSSAHWQNELENIKAGLGEERIKPEIYYNLFLVADDVAVEYVYAVDDQVWILDQGGPRLISLDLSDKQAEIITGDEQLEDQRYVVSSRDRIYTISDQAIFLLEGEALTELQELDENTDLVAAGGWLGNLYLLDNDGPQIWQYPAITGGLGNARAWVADGLEESSAFVNMAIDGSIWLLTKEGSFYEYLSGERQSLNLELPSGIGQATMLAVSQEQEKLAFWDEENKTIWLFNKNGEFQSRLPLDLEGVKAISFTSQADGLYIIGSSKVYLLEDLSF